MANNGINLYGSASDNLSNPSLADWAQYVAKAAAAVAIKTATYSITDLDRTISCSGTFSATLPSASTVSGREFTVRNVGTGTVTVTRNAGETIDGAATNIAIPSYGAITVVSNGTNWLVLNGLYTDTSNYSFIWDNKTAAFVRIIRLTDTNVSLSGNLTVAGTVSLPNGTVTSNMILDGTIINDDISNSASISQSKINNLTSDLASKAPLTSPILTGTVTLPADVRGWATNLLTTNQASVETDTTGLSAFYGCSIAPSTAQAAHGLASVLVTTSAATSPTVSTSPWNGIPVISGRVYTGAASVRVGSATGRTAKVGLWWYTAAGNGIGGIIYGQTVTLGTSWQRLIVSAVAPATAAYGILVINSPDAANTETFYVDCMGFWEGAGGEWALPGRPINALGTYTDETVGRRIFTWDTVNARWQMTYGDTGWRDISASLSNSWAGGIYVRRQNATVFITGDADKTSATADPFWAIPSGFQPPLNNRVAITAWDFAADTWQLLHSSGVNQLSIRRSKLTSGAAYCRFSGSWLTSDSWPTSLPGTAAGSIPT